MAIEPAPSEFAAIVRKLPVDDCIRVLAFTIRRDIRLLVNADIQALIQECAPTVANKYMRQEYDNGHD